MKKILMQWYPWCECLLQTVRVPPCLSVFVKIAAETGLSDTPVVFEPSEGTQQDWGVSEDCLLDPSYDGTIRVLLTNPASNSQIMQAGEVLGQVMVRVKKNFMYCCVATA